MKECVGQRYGKLTITRFVEFRKTPRGARVPMVECLCDCGRTKIVSIWDLRSGKTKTCAFDHPHYEDRTRPAFNAYYKHVYKGRALKSGIEFDITEEQFRKLGTAPCHYCGTKPEDVKYRHKRGSIERCTVQTGQGTSQWIHNGLDRIDSDKGYTMDNVVTCCGICNHAKHTMSYEDFIRWLDMVASFRGDLAKSELYFVAGE